MPHTRQPSTARKTSASHARIRRHPAAKVAKFAAAQALGMTQTAAAEAAGYSPSHAASAGVQLAQRGDVQEQIAGRALDAAVQTSFTVAELVEAVAEIAFMDPGDYFDASAMVRPGVYRCTLQEIHQLPKRARRVISQMRVVRRNLTAGDGVTDEVVEIRWWNKLEAMRLLMEHKGLLVQKIEVDVLVLQKKVAKMDDATLAEAMAEAAAQMAADTIERARLRLPARVLDGAVDVEP